MTREISLRIHPIEKRYSIQLFPDFSSVISALKSQIAGRNFLVVTDKNIAEKTAIFSQWKPEHLLVLNPGESAKSWGNVKKICHTGFEKNLDRDGVIITLGGGVVTDLAGFAASVFMRGISFINIPTSLLGMVDASVGGKTGIDCEYGKNLIGAFHHPESIFLSQEFLSTLPESEVQNGLCEMIKHGIIASETHFRHLQNIATTHPAQKIAEIFSLVGESIEIKKSIIEQDEKEAGIRGFLNLGHTFGHAIERISHFSVPHGKAVAIGCVLAARFAYTKNLCTTETPEEIEKIFADFGIDTACPYSTSELWEAMQTDKKKKDGQVRLILPKHIGEVCYYPVEEVEFLAFDIQ